MPGRERPPPAPLSTGRRGRDFARCLLQARGPYTLMLLAAVALAVACGEGAAAGVASLAVAHLSSYWTHRLLHTRPALRVIAWPHAMHHTPDVPPGRDVDALEFGINAYSSGGGLALLAYLWKLPLASPAAALMHAVMYSVSHLCVLHAAQRSVHLGHHARDGTGLPPDRNFAPDAMDALFGTKPPGQPLGADITCEAVCAGGALAAAAAAALQLARPR